MWFDLIISFMYILCRSLTRIMHIWSQLFRLSISFTFNTKVNWTPNFYNLLSLEVLGVYCWCLWKAVILILYYRCYLFSFYSPFHYSFSFWLNPGELLSYVILNLELVSFTFWFIVLYLLMFKDCLMRKLYTYMLYPCGNLVKVTWPSLWSKILLLVFLVWSTFMRLPLLVLSVDCCIPFLA